MREAEETAPIALEASGWLPTTSSHPPPSCRPRRRCSSSLRPSTTCAPWLRGETRPSRTTWLIWTPLAWLTVAGSIEAGADATLAKLVASALGVTAIAALALFRGTGGRTGSDFLCLALTGVGVGPGPCWMIP